MQRIESVTAIDSYQLRVVFSDGSIGMVDCSKYLNYEVFAELKEEALFRQVRNGGYFVYWPNGADLSADTLYLESNIQPKAMSAN